MGQGLQLRLLEVGRLGGRRGPTGWSRVQRVPVTGPRVLGHFYEQFLRWSKHEGGMGERAWVSGVGLRALV